MTSADATALTIISVVVTGLTAAVGALYAEVKASKAKTEETLKITEVARDACEKDRDSIWEKLNNLSSKVGYCPIPGCPHRTPNNNTPIQKS